MSYSPTYHSPRNGKPTVSKKSLAQDIFLEGLGHCWRRSAPSLVLARSGHLLNHTDANGYRDCLLRRVLGHLESVPFLPMALSNHTEDASIRQDDFH